jgi:hypothetical protein
MPTLSRYFIKTAFVHLLLGLGMSLLLAAQASFGLPSAIMTLRPVYLHLIVLGWLTQLIMGVAYWMFPKFSKEKPRGNEKLAWSVYGLLNLGLLLRSVGEPLAMLNPTSGYGWILVLASICLLAAGWGFVLNTWTRVKER